MVIDIPGLRLTAATRELMLADLAGADELAVALGAHVPAGWPPALFDQPAPGWAIEQARHAGVQPGWLFWYLQVPGPGSESGVIRSRASTAEFLEADNNG